MNRRIEPYLVDQIILIGWCWTVLEPQKKQFLIFHLNGTDMAFGALWIVKRIMRWWDSPADVYCVFLWYFPLHGSWFLHILFHFAAYTPGKKKTHKKNPGPASLFRKTLGKMTQLLRWPSSTCHYHHPSVRHPWYNGFWSLIILYFIASSVTILSLKV